MTGALSGGNVQSLRLVRLEQERDRERQEKKGKARGRDQR